METKNIFPVFILLACSVILAACNLVSAQALDDPTAVPIVDDFAVVAEGRTTFFCNRWTGG
jgi:hypothetical protein